MAKERDQLFNWQADHFRWSKSIVSWWLLHPYPPNPSLAMHRIGLIHPIAENEGTIRRDDDADWPEVLVALHKRLRLRRERRAPRLQLEPFDDVIAPARRDELADVFLGQAVRFVGHDAARC